MKPRTSSPESRSSRFPPRRASDPKVCTLDTVVHYPYDDKMAAILQQKLIDLTGLELRAHPSWHPILELYRSGLSTLINLKNPEEAQKLISQAHDPPRGGIVRSPEAGRLCELV